MNDFSLPPDVVAQLMQMGALNRQDELLQQQLAQAEALRQMPQRHSYGAMAGIGNGIANAVNGIHAGFMQHDSTQGLEDNMKKETSGALALAGLLNNNPMSAQMAQAQALKQKPPAMLDADPSQAMAGYGFGDY
jgi:hypothetical protein